MPSVINVARNIVTPVVTSCTGTGTTASAIFVKTYEVSGSPGQLVCGLLNVVGSFDTLQFNFEYTASQASPNWEVVKVWNPLTDGVGYFPISESGFYRFNCVDFSGGTSVDVDATVGLPAGLAESGGSGPTADVTLVGSTITLPVSITGQPIDVNVVSGGGSNASVGTNDTTAPTSSTQIGVQASDNLVALRTCDTFNTFQSQGGTPGQQGVWTPASGKSFRLMKVWVTVSGNANTSGGGLLTIYFTDGPAGPVVGSTIDVWIQPPTAANAGGYFDGFLMNTGIIDMGNGYLSGGANTTLYLNTSLQLTAGFIRVNTFGTEE